MPLRIHGYGDIIRREIVAESAFAAMHLPDRRRLRFGAMQDRRIDRCRNIFSGEAPAIHVLAAGQASSGIPTSRGKSEISVKVVRSQFVAGGAVSALHTFLFKERDRARPHAIPRECFDCVAPLRIFQAVCLETDRLRPPERLDGGL